MAQSNIRNDRRRRVVRATKVERKRPVMPAETDEEREASHENVFGRYVHDVRGASVLLTADDEIGLGRAMVDRAVAAVLERLAFAELVVRRAPRRKECRPFVPMAKAFIADFNPKGLKGARLEKRLVDLYFAGSSPQQEVMINGLKRDRQGSAIVHRLISSNLRLVINVAKKYVGLLPLTDLVQEGNIGLMHAVPRYDYRRGYRFSTYATWWIRHAIGRALADKGRTVRLPVHLLEAAHKIGAKRAELAVSLGRMPSDAELSKAVRMPADKIEKIRAWTLMPVSLDEPVDHEREDPMGDFLVDEQEELPEWAPLIPGKHASALEEALARLRPIEQDVLRMRFGLGDTEDLTFREIGDKYNLSRERIRQIQESALSKLRRSLQHALGPAAL